MWNDDTFISIYNEHMINYSIKSSCIIGEDVKDFSRTIAKHSGLVEAVARASRIHQVLATDIENEG